MYDIPMRQRHSLFLKPKELHLNVSFSFVELFLCLSDSLFNVGKVRVEFVNRSLYWDLFVFNLLHLGDIISCYYLTSVYVQKQRHDSMTGMLLVYRYFGPTCYIEERLSQNSLLSLKFKSDQRSYQRVKLILTMKIWKRFNDKKTKKKWSSLYFTLDLVKS